MPTTWLMRSKKASNVKESDFSQFPDARVREVMAAAANLVECMRRAELTCKELDALEAALFAAQHSKPKCPVATINGITYHSDVSVPPHTFVVQPNDWECPGCDAGSQHSKPRRTPMHRTHDDDGMPVDRDADGNDIVDD